MEKLQYFKEEEDFKVVEAEYSAALTVRASPCASPCAGWWASRVASTFGVTITSRDTHMRTRDPRRLHSADMRTCARRSPGGSILQKYAHAHEGLQEAPFCRDTHIKVLVVLCW